MDRAAIFALTDSNYPTQVPGLRCAFNDYFSQ
jgi:hypothetical protein